jgi:hypothetical protein
MKMHGPGNIKKKLYLSFRNMQAVIVEPLESKINATEPEVYTRGTDISKISRNHNKVLGIGRMTQSKFLTEDPQIAAPPI